ncbi:NUDIX hydrolase [Paraburkholderia sp. GAS42]|uniref:NUDIX hydrolase n=1 Tax=Paraburkholderia sp. GAS42 TaxID=3035135 RepID=UPI003D257BE4
MPQQSTAPINGRDTLKQRATVVCQRGTHILLVRQEHARWSLPGGRAKADESLEEAAVRELVEETHLRALGIRYMFEFVGVRTCHHVFVARIAGNQSAVPGSEIARCRWVDVSDVSSFATGVSTRGIVDILAMSRRPSLARSRHQRAEAFIQNLELALQSEGFDSQPGFARRAA